LGRDLIAGSELQRKLDEINDEESDISSDYDKGIDDM
jgi:hypothetical protein